VSARRAGRGAPFIARVTVTSVTLRRHPTRDRVGERAHREHARDAAGAPRCDVYGLEPLERDRILHKLGPFAP
jgi:hypothetical protein